jgi:hypothetical protein
LALYINRIIFGDERIAHTDIFLEVVPMDIILGRELAVKGINGVIADREGRRAAEDSSAGCGRVLAGGAAGHADVAAVLEIVGRNGRRVGVLAIA